MNRLSRVALAFAMFDLKKLLEGTDYEGLRRAVQDAVNR